MGTDRRGPWMAAAGIALLAWTLGGCGIVQDALGDRPTARVVGVGLEGLDLQGATLRFDVEVANPYPVALPLLGLDYALASGAESFLTGQADLEGSVPARGQAVVPLPVRVEFSRLLTTLAGVRPGAVVPYRADLGLRLDTPAGGLGRLPLQHQGQLPVPAPLEVSQSQFTWDQVGLDHVGGRLRVHLVNHNSFPLQLQRMGYTLALAGKPVAQETLSQGLRLEAGGGGGTVELPVAFSPRRLGGALLGLIRGTPAEFGLDARLGLESPFGPLELPLSLSGRTALR